MDARLPLLLALAPALAGGHGDPPAALESVDAALPAPRTATVGALTQLREQAVHVSLVGEPGPRLRGLHAVVLRTLPLVEEEAGFSWPGGEELEVHLDLDGSSTGGYGGLHDGGRVHLAPDVAPSSLVHELAHAWFAGDFAAEHRGAGAWVVEGLAHHVAWRVLTRAPELGDADELHRALADELERGHCAAPLASWAPPFPLADEESDRVYGWYAKAYGFFHLVAAVAGDDALRAVNADVHAAGEPVSGAAYLARLAAADERLAGCGEGWVVEGRARGAFDPGELDDSDRDGLSRALERRHGTSATDSDSDNDGVPDGVEVRLGSDPVRRGSTPLVRPYVLDGDLGDWSAPTSTTRFASEDNVGDVEEGVPAACDLVRVDLDGDASAVWLALRLAGSPGADTAGCAWCLGLDADGDERFEALLQAEPSGRVAVYSAPDGDGWGTETPVWGARLVWRGERVELRVPRGALPLRGPVRAFPFTTTWSATAPEARTADRIEWIPLLLR